MQTSAALTGTPKVAKMQSARFAAVSIARFLGSKQWLLSPSDGDPPLQIAVEVVEAESSPSDGWRSMVMEVEPEDCTAHFNQSTLHGDIHPPFSQDTRRVSGTLAGHILETQLGVHSADGERSMRPQDAN